MLQEWVSRMTRLTLRLGHHQPTNVDGISDKSAAYKLYCVDGSKCLHLLQEMGLGEQLPSFPALRGRRLQILRKLPPLHNTKPPIPLIENLHQTSVSHAFSHALIKPKRKEPLTA